MRTDDLICMMAKTPPCSCAKRNIVIWGSIAALFAAMVASVLFIFGPRPDLADMTDNYDMLFKYAFLAALATGSGIAWWESGHPGRSWRVARFGLVFLVFLLLALAGVMIATTPSDLVIAEIFNVSAYTCVIVVASFALVGSFVLTALTRCMAPMNCRLHAVLTTLFAASLGAMAYGLHCQSDSPGYLAIWYGGTALAVTLAVLPVLMKKQSW